MNLHNAHHVLPIYYLFASNLRTIPLVCLYIEASCDTMLNFKYWVTSRRNLGESGSVTQTLFYGLRKSGKNAIPVATVPRCDITLSHMHLVRVLYCNTTLRIMDSPLLNHPKDVLLASCAMLVIIYHTSMQCLMTMPQNDLDSHCL